jgi:hypothetical protein
VGKGRTCSHAVERDAWRGDLAEPKFVAGGVAQMGTMDAEALSATLALAWQFGVIMEEWAKY